MTTKTIETSQTGSVVLAVALAAGVGLGLIFVAGFASAAVIHDTGHDQRHSLSFPCH